MELCKSWAFRVQEEFWKCVLFSPEWFAAVSIPLIPGVKFFHHYLRWTLNSGHRKMPAKHVLPLHKEKYFGHCNSPLLHAAD